MGDARLQCPVCDAATEPTTSQLFLRCDRCGVRFRTEAPTADEARQLHETLYFGEGESIEMTPTDLLDQYVDFVHQRVGLEGTTVLDFGCGTAPTGHLIRRRGGSYLGVEFSPAARATLRNEGLEVVSDLDAVSDRSFDIALMIEVIEHLPDPVATLRSVRDVLQPEGHLFVVTPNAGGLKSRILGDAWEQAALPAHVVLFDAGSLRRTLRRAGFGVVSEQRWLRHERSLSATLIHRALQAVALDGGLRYLATPV